MYSLSLLDLQIQKMGGAGDAGIVVADSLLAQPGELFLWQADVAGNELIQVMFDHFLILGGRGNDFGIQD